MRASETTPSTPQPEPRWSSIRDAASIFKIAPWTLRGMISRGEVTAVRLGPRLIRVDLNSIPRAIRTVKVGE